MTNQKELTVSIIKSQLRQIEKLEGIKMNKTPEHILFVLENEQLRSMVYQIIENQRKIKNLTAQLKRQQLKNSTNTVQIHH
jgi:hypothetical protein